MISVAYAASSHGAEHGSILSTPEFWLFFTFSVLVAIVIVPVSRAFKVAMTVRGAKIKKRIIAAQVLRADTEKLLQDYLKKQEHVEDEIKSIVSTSKKHAENIRDEAENKLKQQLKIREKQVLDNISLLEKTALSEINAKITDITLSATQTIISNSMDVDKDNRLVDKFTSELPKTLNNIDKI